MKLSKFLSSLVVLLALAFAVFASPPDIGKTTETTIKAEKAATQAQTPVVVEIQTETACRDVCENFQTTKNKFTQNLVFENKTAFTKIDYPIRS